MKTKSYLFIAIILTSLFLVFSCFKGYTSKDGKKLKMYLAPEKLKELINTTLDNSDDSIYIVDVRPADNYKEGHIPSAKSFPSSEVMSRLDELPKDKSLILYCETGGRAQAVIKMLEKQGYTKMLNWGGYTRWPYDLVQK